MNLDDIFAVNDSTEAIDNKLDAQRAIDKLGRIDRAILYLWAFGFTQAQIGIIFGYSQGHVSKLLDQMNNKH